MGEQEFDQVNIILLSLLVLIEALSSPFSVSNIGSEPTVAEARPSVGFRSSHLLRRRFQAAGWCPKAVEIYEAQASSPTCSYFASGIDRRTQGKDHSSCSPDTCELLPKDEMLYESQHAQGCDVRTCVECILRNDQIEDMGTLLRNGQFPVITIDRNLTENLHVSIHAAVEEGSSFKASSPNSPNAYVAISHVWAEYDSVRKHWKGL